MCLRVEQLRWAQTVVRAIVTLQIDDTASGLSTIGGQAITLVNGADDTSVVGQYNDGSETPATASYYLDFGHGCFIGYPICCPGSSG